jgi:hypothetical protein
MIPKVGGQAIQLPFSSLQNPSSAAMFLYAARCVELKETPFFDKIRVDKIKVDKINEH